MTQRAGSWARGSGGQGQTMSGWKIVKRRSASLRSQALVSRWTISSISLSTCVMKEKAAGLAPGRDGRRVSLEDRPNTHLNLPRVSGAALDGAVEIEDQVGHLGPVEILAVEDVENLDARLEREPRDHEGARKPQIERGKLVVLASQVPPRHGAVRIDPILRSVRRHARRRHVEGLRGAVGIPEVRVDVAGSLPEEPRVDAVALIPVGVSPLLGELRC